MKRKIKNTYFERVDYFYRNSAAMKFLTKKAWYNFYAPLSYKMFYFCAFICFSFIILRLLFEIGMPFPQLSGGALVIGLLGVFALCSLWGIIPALSIIFALVKALK